MKLNFNFYSRDLANKFRAGVGSRFVFIGSDHIMQAKTDLN